MPPAVRLPTAPPSQGSALVPTWGAGGRLAPRPHLLGLPGLGAPLPHPLSAPRDHLGHGLGVVADGITCVTTRSTLAGGRGLGPAHDP